jgi:hypothetical protein
LICEAAVPRCSFALRHGSHEFSTGRFAFGKAVVPTTATLATPKSRAKAPICEMTIRPDVARIVIITNSSQKTRVFSITPGATPVGG